MSTEKDEKTPAIAGRAKQLGEALADAMRQPDAEAPGVPGEATEQALEDFYRRTGQVPETEDDGPDPFEEIEAKMKAWGDPIAETLLTEAKAAGLALPPDMNEAEAHEAVSTLISGLAAAHLPESLKRLLSREAQEAGIGILRFKRDAIGEVCVTVDGVISPFGRMSVHEMYVTEFARQGLPKIAVRAARLAEAAFLDGSAYLLSFAYDASASTPEEAVYAWQPTDEEREEIRDGWREDDKILSGIETRRELRGARIEAKLADAGSTLPPFIKDGLTDIDFAMALDLLGARLETYLNDERCPGEVILRQDGSALIDPQDGSIVPIEATTGWLAEAFAQAEPNGLPIPPAELLAWCRAHGHLVGDDLFEGLHVRKTPDGLTVSYAK